MKISISIESLLILQVLNNVHICTVTMKHVSINKILKFWYSVTKAGYIDSTEKSHNYLVISDYYSKNICLCCYIFIRLSLYKLTVNITCNMEDVDMILPDLLLFSGTK